MKELIGTLSIPNESPLGTAVADIKKLAGERWEQFKLFQEEHKQLAANEANIPDANGATPERLHAADDERVLKSHALNAQISQLRQQISERDWSSKAQLEDEQQKRALVEANPRAQTGNSRQEKSRLCQAQKTWHPLVLQHQ